MPALYYIIKLSVGFAIIFLFYQFVLRRLTFYTWNRWYLLGYTMLCFLFAAVDVNPFLQQNELSAHGVVQMIPVIYETGNFIQSTTNADPATVSFLSMLIALVVTGMIFKSIMLFMQYLSYRKIRKNATKIISDGLVIYQVDKNIIPFSFGNAVFINRELHTDEELEKIIRHEFVHVRQKHTIDIMWSEFLCIINWFNPFVWMLRKAIRQNLEFIADNNVLNEGIDKKQYQYLLLKVIGNTQFSIANQFNFSSLKKRIAMMNKIKSARLNLVRFIFLLPLAAVLMLAFRNRSQVSNSSLPVTPGSTTHQTDSIPYSNKTEKGYYIDIKDNKGNCTVVVSDDKKLVIDRISLDKWKEDKSYEAKYGALPPPPKVIRVENISDDFEITSTKAFIKLKNGKSEEYDLTNSVERRKFEEKYGKIIEVPQAPAPPAAPGSITEPGEPAEPEAPPAVGEAFVLSPFTPGNAPNVMMVGGPEIKITGEEDVVIRITKNTTAKELHEFERKMTAEGVNLKFTEIKWKDGKIDAIQGTMQKNESKSNFNASQFETVTLAMEEIDGRIYFKVIINEKNFC